MHTTIKSVRTIISIVLIFLACLSLARPLHAEESQKENDARMKWWREARFGMFIHWGIYSVPAGRWNGHEVQSIGEWIMSLEKIPMKDYQALAKQFNPVNYNADKWVKMAKDAGMKYIVITAKHHDGFAMFCSKASSFNICDASPYKRDPLKDLAAACKKYGIKLGFYYSQSQDWNHPGGGAYFGKWDPGQEGNYDEFIRNIDVPQVKELLTNYGDVSVLWWDSPMDMTETRQKVLSDLLKLQPNIISNNRLGGGGDFRTPEQDIPINDNDGDWETCMTMNNTWGYKVDDNNWKSPTQIVRMLSQIASLGGNYLLNVGPNSLGEIPNPSIECLKVVGQWMKVNGESIYGTSKSPFRNLPFDGVVTVKGSKMFVHVWDWPADGINLGHIENKIKTAKFLGSKEAVRFETTRNAKGLTSLHINKPQKTDLLDTVVEVSLDRQLSVSYTPVQAEVDGTLALRAADARFTRVLKYDYRMDSTSNWLGTPDMAYWDVNVPKAGNYSIEVTYAWYKTDTGSEYSVGLKGADILQRVKGTVVDTGSWTDFKTFTIGTIDLKSGILTLDITAQVVPKGGVMNLRQIKLTPISAN